MFFAPEIDPLTGKCLFQAILVFYCTEYEILYSFCAIKFKFENVLVAERTIS